MKGSLLEELRRNRAELAAHTSKMKASTGEIAKRRAAREDVWGVSLHGGKFTVPEDRS